VKTIAIIFLIRIILVISSLSLIHPSEKATALFLNTIDCKNYLEYHPPISVSGDYIHVPSHNIKYLCVHLLSISGPINILIEGLIKCEKHIMLNETTFLSNPHINPGKISFICNNLNPSK
jgi:hypothetical protein